MGLKFEATMPVNKEFELKQLNKQALYVEFLKQCRDNIANYSRRVGTLVKAAQYCKDHGIMVTNV